MADPFRKVAPGEKLTIPAKAYNTFIDAAKDFQARKQNVGQKPKSTYHTDGMVMVRNDSGADRGMFDVLGIDTPLYLPAASEPRFLNNFVLKGVTPDIDDHFGLFVIVAEPIADGYVGRAYISGVCPAWIDVIDADHQFVDVYDANATKLKTYGTGSARILWKAAGTGAMWAVVHLVGGGIDEIRFGKPTGAYTSGATITLDPCDIAGVDNGLANVTVQAGWTLPTNTNIPTTAIIPFTRAATATTWHVIGDPREVVTNLNYNTTTHKLQKKVRYDFGIFATTESSAWVDITTAVNCTA